MPQPDTGDDWFEITNTGTVGVNLENFFVHGKPTSNKKTLSGNLAPGQYLVFYWSDNLNNESGTLKLHYQQGDSDAPIDETSYSSSTSNISWSRLPDDSLCQTQPSPNLANSSCIPPSPVPTAATPIPTNNPGPTDTPSPTPTPAPVYNPEISISSVPPNLKQSQLFMVAFLAKSLKPNTDYYVKLYGGKGGDNFGIETKGTSLYLNYTSTWEEFPTYRSDNNGQINKAVVGRIKPEGELGEYLIRMKIKEINSETTAESPPRAINISVLQNPTATPSIEPFPTSSEEDEPSQSALLEFDQDQSNVNVLGTSETTPIVETGVKDFNPNAVPIIFMVAGGLMLAVPLAINKFSQKNEPSSQESETIEE